MVGLLLALTFQNPLPPDVKLPEGWAIHYWGSAGFGSGALLGPNKEEILFSGYSPTGAMAVTTHEADRNSLFLATRLDGRKIEVTVRDDGTMVVSFPSFGQPLYAHGFDYWTRTKTPREAATALMLSLTRLEVKRDTDRDKEDKEQGWTPTREYPFATFGVSGPFRSVPATSTSPAGFEKLKAGSGKFQSEVPTESKWQDKKSFFGRELRWGEDKSGHAWAAVDNPKAVFVASESNPQWIVASIVLALNYRPVP